MSDNYVGLTARSAAHHFGRTQYEDHFVYRCFDADGDLIYIGCTHNVERRIYDHRRGKGAKASIWLSVFMDRYEVDGPYRGRSAGRAAEARAIKAEQPLFNYQERATVNLAAWMTRRPIAEYLVERGHIELALDTVCLCWSEARAAGQFDDWCVAHKAAALAGMHSLTERGAAA